MFWKKTREQEIENFEILFTEFVTLINNLKDLDKTTYLFMYKNTKKTLETIYVQRLIQKSEELIEKLGEKYAKYKENGYKENGDKENGVFVTFKAGCNALIAEPLMLHPGDKDVKANEVKPQGITTVLWTISNTVNTSHENFIHNYIWNTWSLYLVATIVKLLFTSINALSFGGIQTYVSGPIAKACFNQDEFLPYRQAHATKISDRLRFSINELSEDSSEIKKISKASI